MHEELDAILRRVASGELTPEEAEPLVEAATGKTGRPAADSKSGPPATGGDASGWQGDPLAEAQPGGPGGPVRRTVRLEVLENGRTVTTLRIPMSWASLANVVPGLSRLQTDRIREAIRSGSVGPILEVQDEDGDGVIISTE
jgi:hypothetical protein